MARIQVLEKQVAELIAAGEVVERPASVIKELVENCIDAGAKIITVEIQNGGVTYMRVTDNGCGIERDDVPTALLRHATSKVNTAVDLEAIGSLGFRGEALASISAVSHVELLTRTESQENGTRLLAHAGDIESLEEAGCPTGTTIIVRELFYNVPARMKFLKKDVGEGNAIAQIMDKIALSHPEISVRFIRERKEQLRSPGDGKLESAVYAVYGKEFLASLMPVNYKLAGISVEGFVSKPQGARPNRAMQSMFINGRYVRSRTAMAALEESFKGSIVGGKFPACVLHIGMDFSFLDVNVHPAKLEVRFVNEKPIFDAVYHGVKSALSLGDSPRQMPLSPQPGNLQQRAAGTGAIPPIRPAATAPEIKLPSFTPSGSEGPQASIPRMMPRPIDTQEIKPAEFSQERLSGVNEASSPLQQPMAFHDSEERRGMQRSAESKIENMLDESPMPQPMESQPQGSQPMMQQTIETEFVQAGIEAVQQKQPGRLVGEIFQTYIVLELKDSILLVDKHAAHERFLYEKLKQEGPGSEAQQLISPVSVSLDKLSYSAVLEHSLELDKAGFAVDDFGGGTVLVRSAPLSMERQDIADAIVEISGYLCQNGSEISTKQQDWIYHNVACRAAIKGGQKTSEQELTALAQRLYENPDIRYCPHGRPVFVEIKRREIEKNFGRA